MSGAAPIMPETQDAAAFEQLWRAIRAGQSSEYRQLVGACTPHLLKVVRKRLDRRLRPRFDSIDFAQAVWLSFVAQLSQLPDFESTDELQNYLAQMAANKVVDEVRKQLGQCRDVSREDPEADSGIAPSQSTPSQFAIANERLERLKAGRPAAHQQIIQLKLDGESLPDIAQTVGLSERQVRRVLLALEAELNAAHDRLHR
jgi:RNA polymerase sigma factor (sigma-70 family)